MTRPPQRRGARPAPAQPAPPAPPAAAKGPPRRLRWVGVILVAIAAYAYYFLGNLPQAETLDPNTTWSAAPLSRFVLRDPAPGRLLSIDVRCPGTLGLTISPAVSVAGA